jgi:hypothetical protein
MDLVNRRLLALLRSNRRLQRFTRYEMFATIKRTGPRGRCALETILREVPDLIDLLRVLRDAADAERERRAAERDLHPE